MHRDVGINRVDRLETAVIATGQLHLKEETYGIIVLTSRM